MAIGVSAILGQFLILDLYFSVQDCGMTVALSMGQPVMLVFLDTVCEKGTIVMMVSVSLGEKMTMAYCR